MAEKAVRRFRKYPLKVGDRVFLEDGPRRGEWEVMDIEDEKMTLRCPISHRLTYLEGFYSPEPAEKTDE